MANVKPARLVFRIRHVAHLRCFVERPRLMWYEEVYVTPRHRGKGYAKWLFHESIRHFDGRVEVDVLNGVSDLPPMFRSLGFRQVGRSERYYNCTLWRLDRRRNGAAGYVPKDGLPATEEVREWVTRTYQWYVRVYRRQT